MVDYIIYLMEPAYKGEYSPMGHLTYTQPLLALPEMQAFPCQQFLTIQFSLRLWWSIYTVQLLLTLSSLWTSWVRPHSLYRYPWRQAGLVHAGASSYLLPERSLLVPVCLLFTAIKRGYGWCTTAPNSPTSLHVDKQKWKSVLPNKKHLKRNLDKVRRLWCTIVNHTLFWCQPHTFNHLGPWLTLSLHIFGDVACTPFVMWF